MADFCLKCGGPIDEEGMCNYCAFYMEPTTGKDLNTIVFGIGLVVVMFVLAGLYVKSYYFIKPYLMSLAGDRAELAEMILDASIFAEIWLFFLLIFSMKQEK